MSDLDDLNEDFVNRSDLDMWRGIVTYEVGWLSFLYLSQLGFVHVFVPSDSVAANGSAIYESLTIKCWTLFQDRNFPSAEKAFGVVQAWFKEVS